MLNITGLSCRDYRSSIRAYAKCTPDKQASPALYADYRFAACAGRFRVTFPHASACGDYALSLMIEHILAFRPVVAAKFTSLMKFDDRQGAQDVTT